MAGMNGFLATGDRLVPLPQLATSFIGRHTVDITDHSSESHFHRDFTGRGWVGGPASA